MKISHFDMMRGSIHQDGQDFQERSLIRRIADLYVEGIRSMRLGRTLWKIIAIKLFIIFCIFKFFFFPDLLKEYFSTDAQRADHVIQVLTRAPVDSIHISHEDDKFFDRR